VYDYVIYNIIYYIMYVFTRTFCSHFQNNLVKLYQKQCLGF